MQTFVKTDGSGNFLHFLSRTERELRLEENMVMEMVDPIQTTPVQATYIGEERITKDMDLGDFLTSVYFVSLLYFIKLLLLYFFVLLLYFSSQF